MSIKITVPMPLTIGAAAAVFLIRAGSGSALDFLLAMVAGFVLWGLLAWLEDRG